MSKYNYCVAVAFSLILLFTLLARQVRSEELSGWARMAHLFQLKLKLLRALKIPMAFGGVINLSYKADRHVAESVYAIPVRAPPLVRKNRFGLLTISETIGGMNGTYRITYLLPTRQGLIAIGGAELGRDNGKYADVSIAFPAWTGRADSAQLSAVAHSIMSKKNNIVGTNKGGSLDNAILVFVVGFLVKDVLEIEPFVPCRFDW